MIVERGYLDHWKLALLKRLTGKPDAAEIPLRLWEYCEARCDDFIADADGVVLSAICRWTEKPAALIDALIECRWIEKKRNGVFVRGWRDRQRGRFANRLNGQRGGRPKSVPSSKPGALAGSENKTQENPRVSKTASVKTHGGVEERRGVEMSIRPPTVPQGGQVDVEMQKVYDRIGKWFGRTKPRRMSEQTRFAMSQVWPIEEEELALMERFKAEPANERNVELRSRSRSAETLIAEWSKQLDYANAYFELGLQAPQKKQGPEPDGWREAMRVDYGPKAELPPSFWDLQPSEQKKYGGVAA